MPIDVSLTYQKLPEQLLLTHHSLHDTQCLSSVPHEEWIHGAQLLHQRRNLIDNEMQVSYSNWQLFHLGVVCHWTWLLETKTCHHLLLIVNDSRWAPILMTNCRAILLSFVAKAINFNLKNKENCTHKTSQRDKGILMGALLVTRVFTNNKSHTHGIIYQYKNFGQIQRL